MNQIPQILIGDGNFLVSGESLDFQDYSWIQDFEADCIESKPQNAELGRLL